jgi:hypothetical protein
VDKYITQMTQEQINFLVSLDYITPNLLKDLLICETTPKNVLSVDDFLIFASLGNPEPCGNKNLH